MSNEVNEHEWFRERIAAYLTRGLDAAEREQFERHAADCNDCAATLAEAQDMDHALTGLFHAAHPGEGFEQKIIAGLRQFRGIQSLHPAVRRAATGVAAAILLGGIGYAGMRGIDNGLPWMDSSANRGQVSNLRQIGQAQLLYSNENKGKYPRAYFYDGSQVSTQPAAPAATPELLAEHFANKTAEELSARDSKGDRLAELPVIRQLTDREPINAPVSGVSAGRGTVVMGRPALGDSAAPAGGAGGSLAVNGGAAGKQIDTLHRGYVALGFPAAERDKDSDHHFKPADVSRRTQDESGGRNASPSGGDGLLKLTADPQVTTAGKEVKVVFTDGSNGAPPAPPAAQPAEPAKPGQQEPKAEPTPNTPPTTAQIFQRKIIRNGTMEFEVEGFDAAYMQVTKIVAEEGGFIATTNSEKLPNGKVKGTVILRVPPDHLDVLVLKLRALGDLRGQRISAEDVTKQYTDLESELRADRAMESRLLDIIKNGKGTIRDLVEAEKQLGVWREKIEKIEGELRYYNNLVSLSTLSITLYERDIKTPTAAYETEQVNIGVETEDVEKSRADALAAIDGAKGRVIESKLEQHEAGQYSANIVADVAFDQAGPVIDRLKQLGRVARLDVDRKQTTAGGTGAPQGIKVERRDTRLAISLYNLANVAPRLTTNAAVAAEDVEAAYRTILAAVEKAGGRVVSSNLNRQKADQVSGTINAEVKSDQAAAIEAELRKAGEVMHFTVTENPDTQNVTRTKQGFVIQLDSLAQVPARETVTTQIAATDVAQAYAKIADAVHTAGGRVLTSQLNEQDQNNVAATFNFEIKRDAKATVDKALADAGDAISRSVQRSQDVQNTVDSKVLVQVTLSSAEQLPPRQTTVLGLRVSDVSKSMAAISSLGTVKDSGSSTQSNGRVIAKVVIEVPLDKAFETRTKIADMGHVLMEQDSRDTRLPQGRLAKARFDVTLSNEEMIVARDEGLWSAVKRGLSASVTGLLWSLQLVVVGLCFVLPWALIAYGLWKWVRRSRTTRAAVA